MEWMLMPYRRYFDFKGRSRRKEYWMFALLFVIVYAIGFAVMMGGGLSAMMTAGMDGTTAEAPGPLFFVGAGLVGLFALASIIPSVAVTVRRLHDRDMSGWWYLGVIVASLIPLVGWLASIALLVIMCLPGTPGPNRFGSDPKDPSDVAVFA